MLTHQGRVTKGIGRRKSDLQTGNPLALKLLGWITSADVPPFLTEVGERGFVAKNADAFEITGCDRNAIPEYLGVWECADLEIDEYCHFCGCLCGMHFQEVSQMYYCIQCDTLTDFSELCPNDHDGPEDWVPSRPTTSGGMT